MSIIHLLNLISVGIFGMVLSAAFCEILWTRRKRLFMAVGMAAILLFQGVIYFGSDQGIVETIYPIITHLPLTVALCILNRKCLWPVISVWTAYLCCQIRRWLALLIVTIFSGSSVMQDVTELILTLPILLILLRFIAPSVRSISRYSVSVQCQFGLVPALYYGFDYLTRIDTSLLQNGVLIVVEFMSFVCSVAYLIFVVRISEAGRIRSRLEQMQESLNMQVTQAVREIEALREAQRKTSTYRHDLRHHMQYVSACIENGRLEQAQGYIHEICSEIERSKVTAFCENETANLIFSAFDKRARDQGISISIQGGGIPKNISVSESDLCVLLSNALENALHACQKCREKGAPGIIAVSAYEKKGKLFLQIVNSCDENILFEQGIPVTNSRGHGLGVRSICAIVERYGGMYSFSVKDGNFILRIFL